MYIKLLWICQSSLKKLDGINATNSYSYEKIVCSELLYDPQLYDSCLFCGIVIFVQSTVLNCVELLFDPN